MGGSDVRDDEQRLGVMVTQLLEKRSVVSAVQVSSTAMASTLLTVQPCASIYNACQRSHPRGVGERYTHSRTAATSICQRTKAALKSAIPDLPHCQLPLLGCRLPHHAPNAGFVTVLL